MIHFFYETDFSLPHKEEYYDKWISKVIDNENFTLGDINYIFCDDDYLYNINLTYLNHDTLTDIITFDYTEDNILNSDIYISVDRVAENAEIFNVSFQEELLRVMVHGILHLCGYKDKTDEDSNKMRLKEEEKIKLFHVEHI